MPESLLPLPRHPTGPSGRTWGGECALCMYMYSEEGHLGRYSKSSNASKHGLDTSVQMS